MRTAQQRATAEATRVLEGCGLGNDIVSAVQLRPKGSTALGLAAFLLGFLLPLAVGLSLVPFVLLATVAVGWLFHWREYSTLLVELEDGRFVLTRKGWPGGVGRHVDEVAALCWDRPRQYGDRVVVVNGVRRSALMKFDADLVRVLGEPHSAPR